MPFQSPFQPPVPFQFVLEGALSKSNPQAVIVGDHIAGRVEVDLRPICSYLVQKARQRDAGENPLGGFRIP